MEKVAEQDAIDSEKLGGTVPKLLRVPNMWKETEFERKALGETTKELSGAMDDESLILLSSHICEHGRVINGKLAPGIPQDFSSIQLSHPL
jgi:hypothetical protein